MGSSTSIRINVSLYVGKLIRCEAEVLDICFRHDLALVEHPIGAGKTSAGPKMSPNWATGSNEFMEGGSRTNMTRVPNVKSGPGSPLP